ncbi:two-partner secretion domain-containing protein, partial [Nostoc sp. 'Peltigera membranacea cyanobiont' 213]|uniref:two-partner secretion domain-containing protein n=1 Tax=Nostoc sp. 'Peltigera membranacea cyanobiont' 213 TaxID=2014530 RepID=UPI001CB8B8C0
MTQKYILNTFVGVVFFSMLTTFPSEAQVKHDLTLPNNTNIKVEGNKITIEGGTQVGKNLFHSFQDFSLSKGDIAAFNNTLPGFLTKLEEIGVKNCQNVYCKRIPAA